MINAIHIYSPNSSPRLSYVCNVMFGTILGYGEIQFHTEQNIFIQTKGLKLNYSTEHVEQSIQIVPHPIIFEQDIKPVQIEIEWRDGLPFFFHTSQTDCPYDILAMSFFLISRYEEYLPFEKDSHGRFHAKNSIALRNDFLHIPVVHHYAAFLIASMGENSLNAFARSERYKPLVTYDIDNAYAYKFKGLVRTLGGLVKDLAQMRYVHFKHRLSSIIGIMRDPFDTYEYIASRITNSIECYMFFMTSNLGKYDRNMHYKHLAFSKLVNYVSSFCTIGLHPSYMTNEAPSLLAEEKTRLEKIAKTEVQHSRQHFLRLSFPHTYQMLICNGIHHDYSLGYADYPGFRASITVPYLFFDLQKNHITNLTLHPITLMDASYAFYLQWPQSSIIAHAKMLVSEVAKVNGQVHIVFHNESLSEYGRWQGWQKIFEEIISVL